VIRADDCDASSASRSGVGDPLSRVGERVKRGEQPVAEVQADRQPDGNDNTEEDLRDDHERVHEREEGDDATVAPRPVRRASEGERVVRHTQRYRRASLKNGRRYSA